MKERECRRETEGRGEIKWRREIEGRGALKWRKERK